MVVRYIESVKDSGYVIWLRVGRYCDIQGRQEYHEMSRANVASWLQEWYQEGIKQGALKWNPERNFEEKNEERDTAKTPNWEAVSHGTYKGLGKCTVGI